MKSARSQLKYIGATGLKWSSIAKDGTFI